MTPGAVAVERLAHARERAVGPGPVRVERRRIGRERTARPQLAGEQLPALAGAELGVAAPALVEPVEQLPEHVVVRVGMLADVHRRELHAERDDRADRALEPPARDQLAAMLEQRVADEDEVGDELAGAEVRATGFVRPALGQACARVDQLLPDARELEPVRLLLVEALEARVELGQQLEVGGQRRLQLRRGAGDPHGGGEDAAELVDEVERVADRVVVLKGQDVERRLGGDVRVAVAIAADPGPERERTGVEREVDPEPRRAPRSAPPACRAPRRGAARRSSTSRCAPRR